MKRTLFLILTLVVLLAACSPKPTATPVATLPATEAPLLTPTEEPLAEGEIRIIDALDREVILTGCAAAHHHHRQGLDHGRGCRLCLPGCSG